MTITQDKKEIDVNGYVTYYDVPMTKVGVFPYLGRTISPELEPDKVYMVLRPEDELTNPETLKSLENIPFINDHEMLGKEFTPAEEKGIEGTTLENVKVNLPLITNDLKAYTERVKDLIEKTNKRDLSLGYRCRYELTPGIYNGQPYDAIQRDIRFNHIALVDEGRMGSECRVTDNSIVYDKLDIEISKNKEYSKMAKITLDEDLKEELKEEIKKELLGGGEEVIEEKKEDEVIDEEPKEEEKPAVDEETDKRKEIDEVGGFLKDKGLTDEDIRFVIGKLEKIAYNPSETGANDECGETKDEEEEVIEEKKEDKKEEGLSMDTAIKYIAKRDELVEKLKPVIGDNVNYNAMTIEQVVKYGCDKLDIKPSLNRLEGYLSATAKHKKTYITVAKDSINFTDDGTSEDFKNYVEGK